MGRRSKPSLFFDRPMEEMVVYEVSTTRGTFGNPDDIRIGFSIYRTDLEEMINRTQILITSFAETLMEQKHDCRN